MLNNTPSKQVYVISSLTPIVGGYEIPFKYFEPDEVKVYLGNSAGSETLLDDDYYTVDDSSTTPVVKFVASYTFPSGTVSLTLIRELQYEQLSDYQNGSFINAEDIETSFDKCVAMLQQVAEQLDRTIKKPLDETGDIILPSVEQRAGMLLGFGDDGNFKPVLTSDIDQKLQQALAAEESAIAAAGAASESASEASDYLQQTLTAATKALSDISAAKDQVIQLIQEANLEQIEILTQKAEELEASMIEIEEHIASMVTKIKDSESNVSYLANAAKLWANKAIDAANLAAAIKNSCNTILGQVQTIQTTVQGIQSDVQDRQDDVISRQNDIISRQSSVASMQQSVETDKGVVAADKASVETLKEQAVAAKTGAEATAAEIAALKTQIAALAGSTMPGMTFAVGTKIYQRSFYVKNGRTYFHDEEVQQNTN